MNKPTVHYLKDSLAVMTMDGERRATLIALDHPELGERRVQTSVVLELGANGLIETRNSIYVPGRVFAVTGRLCGDDEDTCMVFVAADRGAAVAQFVEAMWKSEWRGDEPTPKQLEYRQAAEANGEGCFVNTVLAADSAIEVL